MQLHNANTASGGQPGIHSSGAEMAIHAQRDLPLAADGQAQRVGLLLPQELAPGSYQLRIGVYDPATGGRLPLTQWAGQNLPSGALAETLVVEGIEAQ
jgi:hypothetical protein